MLIIEKKDILILGDDPTQGLDNTTLTAEKTCAINFIEQYRKICSRSDHNGINSYLFIQIKDSKQNIPKCNFIMFR